MILNWKAKSLPLGKQEAIKTNLSVKLDSVHTHTHTLHQHIISGHLSHAQVKQAHTQIKVTHTIIPMALEQHAAAYTLQH